MSRRVLIREVARSLYRNGNSIACPSVALRDEFGAPLLCSAWGVYFIMGFWRLHRLFHNKQYVNLITLLLIVELSTKVNQLTE